jgi:hypothetical protein
MSPSGRPSTGAQPAKITIAELQRMGSESASPEMLCLTLARILRVNRNEVALLRVEKGCLRFVFPPELREAGFLPMSGSAVAARTASTKSPLLSNSFARVRHVSLFETVKLGGADAEEPGAQQLPIQKIMSVPVTGPNGHIAGVVQISRKGLDPNLAGNDFTNDDLKLLEKAAEIFAALPFMQEGAEQQLPPI